MTNIFTPVGIESGNWYKVKYPTAKGRLFFVEKIITGDCYGRYKNGKKDIFNWQWLELTSDTAQ